MLPEGFSASILRRIRAQPSGTIAPSSISGVLPMRLRMEEWINVVSAQLEVLTWWELLLFHGCFLLDHNIFY